jgi:3-hydroxyacyl-[acyl-carrier-protein] dehydratase
MMTAAVALTARIEEMIPHRAPILLVDEIRSLDSGVSCATSWRVRHEEPVLSGHFPGNPILPGVLLVEHVAQTACILVGPVSAEPGGRLPVLAKIEDCSFQGAVRPGDTVHTEVRLERTLGPFTVVTGESRVGRRRVLKVRLVISLAAAADIA